MANSGSSEGESQRASERRLLPLGMSANLHLASGEKIVVNLRDLSDGGVCAVRNGPLQLRVGARVEIELIDYERGDRLEVSAAVRWLKAGRINTMVGLQFQDIGNDLAAFIAEHRNGGGSSA